MTWPLPSAPVRDLIRRAAQVAVNARQNWLVELDTAVLAVNPGIAADPELAAAVSRSNLANLDFWATANLHAPGAKVAANIGPEPIAVARELVRRGLDAAALNAYRVAEGVAWRRLMEISFELTTDPTELHEMLDVCSRSISAFLGDTLAFIAAQIERERDDLTRGSLAERRAIVALILDGAPIPRQRAESHLGYPLGGRHTAAIVWSSDPTGDVTRLDRVAEEFGHASSARSFSVLAGTGTRWVWVTGSAISDSIDLTALAASMQSWSDIRVAIGPTAEGIDGFRRSHFDAITTQQMMARLRSPRRIALFTEVQLLALVTTDPERATDFVQRTLGDFEHASAELHSTVRTYIDQQCNASRAATRLYTHRNTLLRRLARAETLLPRPLADSSVNVAVALDVVRWRG